MNNKTKSEFGKVLLGEVGRNRNKELYEMLAVVDVPWKYSYKRLYEVYAGFGEVIKKESR